MAGGAEVHLHEILRRLAEAGHEISWLACNYPGALDEERAADGIRYRRRGSWKFANFLLPGLLREELSRESYDVVVEDINKIPFFSPLYTRLPVLAVVPHLFGPTIYRETNFLAASYVWVHEWPIPMIYRRCRFMAISDSTAKDLQRRGIDAGNIDVVHCGMDHHRYMLEHPPDRPADPTIIHLGRLRRYKSVDVVIRAVGILKESFPRIRLNIVGDGPDQARLEELTRSLGLAENVRFLGYLPRDEIVDLLHRSHLFLNPSPKEGWGLTVIEANECGVPVVASRRPGLVDSVQEGRTGELAEYGNPRDFARKAGRILADRALWNRYSEAAVQWARGFNWDDTAAQTLSILERIREERS